MCLFTSDHGSRIFEPDMTPYGVAKAALENTVPRLAAFVGDDNTSEHHIRIFAFSPGAVRTMNQIRRFPQARAEAIARNEQLTPHIMQPEDIVEPVLFLTSSHARYFAGPVIRYNAGQGARRPKGGGSAANGRAEPPTAKLP